MNYARQIILQAGKDGSIKSADPDGTMKHLAAELVQRQLGAAEKFLLPEEGLLLQDFTFCAIDRTKPLHLPFPEICLEYGLGVNAGQEVFADPTGDQARCLTRPTKRVLYAKELADGLLCQPYLYFECHKKWTAVDGFVIPHENFIIDHENGSRTLTCIGLATAEHFFGHVQPLYELLNCLACSNVQTSRFSTAKRGSAGKKIKCSLPFDSYHCLVIGRSGGTDARPRSGGGPGSHRSPREHVRRGTIVRQANGKYHFRNATVVNPGNGGRIHKLYKVTA